MVFCDVPDIIICTAWLFSIHGNDCVKTMIHLGREKGVVRVAADQYECLPMRQVWMMRY